MAALSTIDLDPQLLAAAAESRAWPFEEARKIVDRYGKTGFPEAVLFETGYGPSGLPHIGTFGEVARTTMVRHAFRVLTEDKVKTRLLCFSDDMDGLRKVPDNVPNKEMLRGYLGMPLTRIPDPFSNEYPSFGAANNARLRAFLDRFGFEYEFASSTDYYAAGRFDATLLKMLERFDAIMAIMLPSLREERRAELFAVPADPPQERHRHAGGDRRAQRRRRHDRLARSGQRRALRDAGHRRPRQAAVEARLGDALGSARRRL